MSDRQFFTVPCPLGDAAGSPHAATFDFAVLALQCDECGFAASTTAAARIYALVGQVESLADLFREVERLDPGRLREATREQEPEAVPAPVIQWLARAGS